MRKVVLTETAKEDIREALRQGGLKHGIAAKSRYTLLIKKAIQALAQNPETVGMKQWDNTLFSYHLKFSKHEAVIDEVMVKSPSHSLFFKVTTEEVTILRLLHERSDFERHL